MRDRKELRTGPDIHPALSSCIREYRRFSGGSQTMKRYPFVMSALAIGAVFAGICLASAPSKDVTAAGDEQSVLQTDRAFVEAATTSDKTTLATLADADFTWTDAEGKTQSRAEILKSVPKPALGDES